MNEHEFHFIHSLVAPIAPGCRSESAPSVDVEEHVYEDISTCGSRGSYCKFARAPQGKRKKP